MHAHLTLGDNVWAGMQTMLLAICNLQTLPEYQAIAAMVEPHIIVANLVWSCVGVLHIKFQQHMHAHSPLVTKCGLLCRPLC